MNKDVIYIDVDDDVTAIIGKIKSAKEKVVALVPPKRAGALQSAVNLRLLERMARNDDKKLVLVTHNQALVALAASANIPVAKNLQSKPELAEIPALIVDDADDIIDGADLPVGDHAARVKVKDGTKPLPTESRSDAATSTDLEIDGEGVATSTAVGASGVAASRVAGKKAKIPNFDTFRKKLFFGIIGGIGLIALLIWMFVFAPAATVVITASTTPQSVSSSIKLGGTAATRYEDGIVASTSQQEKTNETLEFDATGQKDVGEKATGTVKFSTGSFNGLGTIPAGTQLTSSSGLVFITDEAVTLIYQGGPSASGTTTVTAADSGEEYNAATGSLRGAPSSVNASFTDATSGGTSKVVKVVSASDIERAKGELLGKSTDTQKKALMEKFDDNQIVVEGSFTVDRGTATSSPAVDTETANGKATLTVPTTYTVQAVAKSELETYLTASLESRIDTTTQKLYDTGIDSATLSNFREDDKTMYATVNATGAIGPEINESDIKDQVKGKRYGDVQQNLEAVDGIKEVDVKFSYFWVRTVPNNTDKITIEFKVEDE